TGDACACADVLSVALTASTQVSNGSNRSRTASSPPESIVSSSAVTTNRPSVIASSSLDIPSGRRLPVSLRREVPPRRRAPQTVVDGRTDVVNLLAPRQTARTLDGFEPDAAHLRLDLTAAVRPDAPARPVAE